MGNASVALHEYPNHEHVEAILAASERAGILTKQLLAYAGKSRIVTRLVDLTELVSQSRDLLRASVPATVSLDFSLANHLPCLEADPSQMQQILMNLVVNGGEAIPPEIQGFVKIATSSCAVTPDMAREHSLTHRVAPGDYACLEVYDNGSGMDEATMARIFDPFFSTKFPGRGLGLAAVQGIVRSHKGFIQIHSTTGEGTTFKVFLPASGKKRECEAPVVGAAPAS